MEPISNSKDAQTGNFNLLSPPVHRVLDALLEGRSIEATDRAALTEEEWMELRALACTANLTRLTLHQPDPTPQAEASALAQAQQTLAAVGARPSVHPQTLESPKEKPSWLDRLRGFLGIERDKD
jgi:hypothetical protein